MVRQDIGTLVARMTLAEKAGQLTMTTGQWAVTGPRATPLTLDAFRSGEAGSVLNIWSQEAVREAQTAAVEESRLGIPLLVGFDVLHGHRTVFPIPLGEAASFDPDLWRRTAEAQAEEALADGVMLTFAPMIDVTRDARWGRISEGPGEDPYVACRMAEAKVKGFQGPGRDLVMAATAKHLGAYGAPLAGRDYASADVSERELAEVHLPSFAAAVAAGVAATMPSFNDLAGIPATSNRALLDGWLRKKLGFKGVIISDYHAIAELITHGVAADKAEAAALALLAGVDIDMMGFCYRDGLYEALQRGLIAMADIDRSVARVLTLKVKLGLFDDPFRGLALPPVDAPRHRALAREAAAKSAVLLTNPKTILPFSAQGGAIAVVGPLASSQSDMMGPWSGAGRGEECVSFADGIRTAFPDRAVVTAASADDNAVLAVARHADIIVFCAGETRTMSGEASCRAVPDLPAEQLHLAQALLGLGKPIVAVLSSGRPLVLPAWFIENCAAVLATWFLGSEAGTALGDLLAGRVSPSGRLPVTWPASTGQIPIHYARRRSGRPPNADDHYTSKYLDAPTEPAFPFGHGQSYSAFSIEETFASSAEVTVPSSFTVRVTARNVGKRAGPTVIYLFIHDPLASVAQPVLKLRRFEKIESAPGEFATVTFNLHTDDFAFVGTDMQPVVETGRIDILIGQRAVESELIRIPLTVTLGPIPPQ